MQQITVRIDEMMCGMCEAHINDCIRRNFKVRKVSSSRKKGQCVILSEEPIDEERLRLAIKETGYTPLSVETKEYVRKRFFTR